MSNEDEYLYSDEEEEEEYTYTDGEDDEEEVMRMEEDESNEIMFQVPDLGYKIIDYQEILPIMNHMIEEVSSLLGLSEDISLVILQVFKWNKEKLVEEYFIDSDKVLHHCGLITTSNTSDDNEFRQNYCRICLDDCDSNNLYSLQCNHKFCRDCYGGYLNSVIGDGPICVTATCPEHQCKQKVLCESIKSLCPSETFDKFMMYMTRNFIETSSTMRWCPFPGCEQVAIGSGVTSIRCSCTNRFCFRCGGESHDPASCRHLELWLEKCSSESESAKWILANTKKCPKCSARIEKNQGCNHMTCKICKHDFCWVCCGEWKDHGQNTGGYYKCNKYEAKADDSLSAASRAKAELDRYLHYYQRYHNHDLALKFAAQQREDAEKRMVEMQSTEKSAWIDVQFLKQAVEQVIECRRILKYTYILGHYMKDNTSEKELYEHHQEMLEKHTERLSELTENASFYEPSDRTHVVNLTRITEKFVNSMISVTMEGQSSFSFTEMGEGKA